MFFLEDNFLEAALFLMVFSLIQVFIVIFFIWLLRKRRVWPLIMCGLSGAGSIAFNELNDKGIEVIFSKKPITGIKRWTFDKVTGKKRINWFPIKKVWHTLAGTAIPVHFCPAKNAASNVSLSDETSRGLNDEESSIALQLAYEQGRVDERNLLPGKGGFQFDWKILLLIAGAGLVLVLALPTILETFGGGV